MSTFVAILLGILKAIPIADKWLDQFINEIISYRVGKIESKYNEKQAKKSVLYKKIMESKDHAEKAILFSALNDIDRL